MPPISIPTASIPVNASIHFKLCNLHNRSAHALLVFTIKHKPDAMHVIVRDDSGSC